MALAKVETAKVAKVAGMVGMAVVAVVMGEEERVVVVVDGVVL